MARLVPFRLASPTGLAGPAAGGQPLASERASLLLCGAPPDPRPLVGFQGVLETIVDHGTTEADCDGTLDGGGVCVTDGKEEGMAITRASCSLPPFSRQLCGQLGWACAHQREFGG